MFVTGSTGNTGMGTITPAYKLTIDGGSLEGSIGIERDTVGTNTIIGALNFTNNNAGSIYGRVRGGRNSAGDGYVSLGTGIGDNLYALEGGNVGINTTTPAYTLDVNGTGRFVAIIETSTGKLKENIEPYTTNIEDFLKLQPISFTWKDTGNKDVGLLAEDVYNIFPEFVSKDNSEEIAGINYSKLSTIFINVLKYQQSQIEVLKEEVKKLTR
jgi:hypothetical protein